MLMSLAQLFMVPDRVPCGGAGQFGLLGSLQHFTKPPVVCPNPTVSVRGWNQAGKVGGEGTVGAFPARNDKGGACLRTLRGDADSHAHTALLSNL